MRKRLVLSWFHQTPDCCGSKTAPAYLTYHCSVMFRPSIRHLLLSISAIAKQHLNALLESRLSLFTIRKLAGPNIAKISRTRIISFVVLKVRLAEDRDLSTDTDIVTL